MPIRRTCTQTFRNNLLKEFPGLGKNIYYWRHLNRLLHCSIQIVYHNCASQQIKAVPISQKHIAFDFGAISEYLNSHFAAIDYINLFRREVYNYDIIDWDYKEHQCRYAVCNFPLHILQLVEDERNMVYSKDKRVIIETGIVFNKDTRTRLRKEDKALATQITKHYNMPQLAIDIQEYLNELPAHRFTRICQHIPEALDALFDRGADGTFIMDLEVQKMQRDILMSILDQPQPFYIPSSKNRTVRLFEINKGLQGVHSHLRKVLTQDCIEVDIQNAHLAIVAKLWGMEDIQDFLRTGKSVWQELLPAMGFSYPNPILKAHLKDYFYGLVYGMGEKRRESGMTQVFGITAFNNFNRHPLVKALLKGRRKRFKEISSMKIFTTPLGKQERVINFTDKEGYYESNVPSLVSQEANDLEMLLLEPIFTWGHKSKEFFIILYQFDGLTIEFVRQNRRDSYLKKMKKLIEERAKELGVITTLNY